MVPGTAFLICASLGVVLAYAFTPVAIRLADRLEFYDKPTGYKAHGHPTPYLGGLAVMLAFFAAVAVLATDWDRTAPILLGTAVLCGLGTIDDKRPVSPGLRLLVEAGLALALFASGLRWELGLGDGVDLAIQVVWVIAVVNAFNLFDNMDGAAGTMGCVVAAGLAVLGLVRGDIWLAGTAAALSGACLGFLPHNLASPSRIFLGDGGSMPVGFAVAALAMVGASDAAAEWQALAMGVLLVGIPALDTTLVIVSRRRRGIPVLTGGRDHLTHRTRARLRTARAVAVALGGAQAMLATLAILAVNGGSGVLVAAVFAYVTAVGTTIALLDGRPGAALAGIQHGQAAATGERIWFSSVPFDVVLAPAVGVGAGLSLFAAGLYHSTDWAPAALVALTLLVALALARPVALRAEAWIALLGLAALALWAMASALWAHSAAQALVEADRLVLYAALLGVCLLLVTSRRSAALALGGVCAGLAGVALWVLARLLAGDASELLLAGRLLEPLGYVNAQGVAFVMGAFVLVALAEHRETPLAARAAGAGGATLFAGLALLSQSRGVALAAVLSTLAVLALVPGRTARVALLVVVAAALTAASASLLALHDGEAGAGASRAAGAALLAAALGAGLAWAAGVAAARRLGPGAERGGRVAAALAVAAGAIVALANAGAIVDGVERRWEAFSSLAPADTRGDGGSRLLAGGGNQFDRWRVGLDAFAERPLAGIGAGNYDVEYYARRRTGESVRQPQSLEIQALSELGLVGAALLVAVVAGVAVAALRRRAAARADATEAALLVAAGGAAAAWLVHASVDWTHLLPGVTAVALLAAAVLLRPGGGPTAPARRRAHAVLRPAAAGLLAALVALGGVSLSRQVLAERFLQDARAALQSGRPADALTSANRSLRLDAYNVRTYYLKAAALARFNQPAAAEAVLLDAVAREPSDFLTYVLLGDLALRRGDRARAGGFYAEAARLNPRDPAVRTALSRARSRG